MPEIEDPFQNFEVKQYLENPIDFQELTNKIRSIIAQSSEHITGVALSSFLQLLEMEKKTCLLQISSKDNLGFLYFFSGRLVNALCDEYEGEEAVYKILCWDNVEIEIREMVRKEQNRINSISKPLPKLLMEVAKLKNKESKDKQDIKEKLLLISEIQGVEKDLANKTVDEKSNEFQKEISMGNVNECLSELMKVDGAMAASVVDAKSGMALGMAGSGINLELAAAGNSEVVRAKAKTMHNLGLKDKIEDILITLGQQYHLIRPLTSAPNLFIYFVLNRAQSNLAMARYKLGELEGKLEV